MLAVYFLPIYFQAVKGQSPVQAGVSLFTLSFTVAPLAIVTGATVTITKKYRPSNFAAWVVMTLGFGLMILIKWDSGEAVWVIM